MNGNDATTQWDDRFEDETPQIANMDEIDFMTLLLESRPGHGTTVRASFSREAKPSARLCAPGEEEAGLVRDVLTGLSGCLPPDCYAERYMD